MSIISSPSIGSMIESRSRCCRVAVLAGWLGCEPNNLRRYEAMYNSLNWHTVVVIAPPDAVSSSYELSASQVASLGYDDDNPRRSRSWKDLQNNQMHDIAANELGGIQRNYPHCSRFIVHAFSNGGCLVYEAMRNILLLQQQKDRTNINTTYSSLRHKFGGVIFDSGPGFFEESSVTTLEEGLAMAMATCSPEEQRKFHVKRRAITELEKINPILCDRKVQLIAERKRDFLSGMQNDPLGGPQLFLYSTSDKLIPYEPLKSFIEHRRTRSKDNNTSLILEKNFLDSPHVLHFRYHPIEYRNAVNEFLNAECMQQSSVHVT